MDEKSHNNQVQQTALPVGGAARQSFRRGLLTFVVIPMQKRNNCESI
jgi:hypothetical protein